MLKSMLTCCKVYISESRNALALESIEQAAKLFPEAPIINRFKDENYNRVGYTLVSRFDPNYSSEATSLKNAVLGMVKAAFDSIDLSSHCGTHPRLGVVDHICFHPLTRASLDQVADLAKSAAAEIGRRLQGFLLLSIIILNQAFAYIICHCHNCLKTFAYHTQNIIFLSLWAES